MIGTKFYNKTLELYDPKTDSFGKPHIRYAWLNCGLIDNLDRCTLNGQEQEIWRVEFSIKSSVKRWSVIELNGKSHDYQSLRNQLDCYDTREKLLTMFAALQLHYFHFKRYIIDQRKDRCPDRKLFNFTSSQTLINPEHPDAVTERKPSTHLLVLIKNLRTYIDVADTIESKKQAIELLRILERIQLQQESLHPYRQDEVSALQILMQRRSQGDFGDTYDTLLQEIKELLKLNDNTVPFLARPPRKKAVQ